MHADEGSRHGRVAGEEQGLALFDEAGEAVADRIGAEVGPVVADAHHDHCWLIGACDEKITLLKIVPNLC